LRSDFGVEPSTKWITAAGTAQVFHLIPLSRAAAGRLLPNLSAKVHISADTGKPFRHLFPLFFFTPPAP
jgi:hypothetical protein